MGPACSSTPVAGRASWRCNSPPLSAPSSASTRTRRCSPRPRDTPRRTASTSRGCTPAPRTSATLGLPPTRLVTFGQSLHWTDRRLVADAVFDVLEPGGSLALVSHDIAAGPPPVRRPDRRSRTTRSGRSSPAPRSAPARRPGCGRSTTSVTRCGSRSAVRPATRGPRAWPARLVRTPTGRCRTTCRCRYAAPHLFGADLDAFVADLRRLLAGITGRNVLGLARPHLRSSSRRSRPDPRPITRLRSSRMSAGQHVRAIRRTASRRAAPRVDRLPALIGTTVDG